MPNRVDNPGSGSRPEPTRPATQGADQARQPAQPEPAQRPATDRVEISAAAQQQAQADQMLANLEGKPLSDLIQIHGILNATSGSVSEEERPMIEYVIAALQAHIDAVRAGDDQ